MTDTPETKTLTAEYDVPENNWERVDTAVEKLNRKAKKLGRTPIVVETLDEFDQEHELNRVDPATRKPIKVIVRYRKYRLTGEAPCIEGWEFVATTSPAEGVEGNFVKRTPGYEGEDVPTEFRTCSLRCDHCHTVRARKDSFAVRESRTGTWKLVGRNCLADFLGGRDPHEVLTSLSWWGELNDLCGGDFDEDEFFGGGGRVLWRFGIEEFLTYVFSYVRRDGWVSRSAARDDVYNELGGATADSAWSLITPAFSEKEVRWREKELKKISGNDGETAVAALEWAEGEFPFEKIEELNDFGANLALALAEGSVSHKSSGLIAAIAVCYNRHLEREIERKRRADRKNEWFGEIEAEKVITRGPNKGKTRKVKPRYELTLTVLAIHYVENDWGTTAIHKMLDEDGRTFTWFGKDMERDGVVRGATFTAVWSIKEHSEYREWKQTVINRPAKIKVEEKENAA